MNFKTISAAILISGLAMLILSMIIIPVGGMSESNPHANVFVWMWGISEIISLVGFILCVIAYRKD